MIWFVYILRCANGSYYVGHSTNADRRLCRHLAGTGAQYTAVHHPEEIVYREQFSTEAEAVRREQQIKGWSRGKKEALISGDKDRLCVLSRSRD